MSESTQVPTFKLNDGTKIPAIAFGTGTKLYGQDAGDYVKSAIEAGFTHIDTAAMYKNEQSIGTALREIGISPSELYITTKYAGGDIQAEARTSLKKLDSVDLYLIHSPSTVSDGNYQAAWKEFEKLQKDGLVKSIGVSNFGIDELQAIVSSAEIIPTVNQIRFHPYNYASYTDVLEFSAKHKIVTEAYSSLAPITKFPGGALDPVLQRIAKRIGGSPAQVIFKWVLAKGVVVVTTSTHRERLDEYLATASLPELTHEEIHDIDEAGSQGPPKVTK